MNDAMNVIEVKDVDRSYEKVRALNGISLSVRSGEIFGLIGPDGAGKTSLFRIIATLLLPDKGTVTVMGYDAVKDFKKLRKLLGYMPGRFSLYQDLTVLENLTFYATIFGTTIQANYHLIKDIYQQIEPFKNRRAGALSGGMKQKLALSCALIHKPELLILDEPTTGVDAISRREFWEMLINLKRSGMTVLVSTPYMDEAELCDRVALIQEGSILELDTPQNIVAGFTKKILKVKAASMVDLLRDLQQYPGTESVQPFGDFVHYIDKKEDAPSKEIADHLALKGHTDVFVAQTPACIEDCFIHLMTQRRPHHGV
jgi:ABC-type multidrug transport system ATPase subunit